MEERLSYYFGGELRKLREKAGFSLKQLSKISSVDKGYLSRIENQLRSPSDSLLAHLYQSLNYNLIIEDFVLSDLEKKLNYLYRDLVYDNPIEEKATDDLFEYHFDSYIYSPLIIKFYLIYYVWLVTKKHDIPLILKIEDRLNELNQKLNSIRKSCKYF